MTTPFYTTNECLVWKTEKPLLVHRQTSPVFTILDAKWRLELHRDNYVVSSNVYYSLDIVNCDNTPGNPFKFALKTWMREEGENVFETYTFLQPVEHNTPTQLWRISDRSLSQMLPKFGRFGVITVVCAFHELQGGCLTVEIDDGELRPYRSCYQDENPSSTILRPTFNRKCLSQDICKLLDNGLMADVTLKCGDHTFSAHKVILAARSDVFFATFHTATTDDNNYVINIEDVDASVMEILLQYLYSGKIPKYLPDDMLLKLYAAAHKLSVYPLKKLHRSQKRDTST